jgi:hypothetical protein
MTAFDGGFTTPGAKALISKDQAGGKRIEKG